jgi:hypothetical protein
MRGAPLGKSGGRQTESSRRLQAGKMPQMAGGTTMSMSAPVLVRMVSSGGGGLQADKARQDQRDEGRFLESSRHEGMLLLWRRLERPGYCQQRQESNQRPKQETPWEVPHVFGPAPERVRMLRAHRCLHIREEITPQPEQNCHAQNNKQVRYAEMPHIGYGVTAAISRCSCVGAPRLLRNQRWKLSI